MATGTRGFNWRWAALVALLVIGAPARAAYWNVFNIEGESAVGADIVTYATLADMLGDSNRLGTHTLNGFGRNIVGSGSDGSRYWNVFNIEGESAVAADIATYASLQDMLTDGNRLGTFTLGGFGRNIVDAGSDGRFYWSVFNIEGESAIGADIVTYGSLLDMMSDSNRLGTHTLNGFGRNIVGSGSDGMHYWNVFNIEGESAVGADVVTYGSLTDMLSDSNRLSTATLNGFGRNIVGSGSDAMVVAPPTLLGEPGTLLLAGLALAASAARRRLAPLG
ncbi:MAG: hypothetical protein ACT6S0_08590 [Roseateles sp.]|uniref:hypothetical protein n=1 Tax=Roseateles sp. TaxID=1971397 RepID=UPI004036D885